MTDLTLERPPNQASLAILPVAQLRPNAYNPNQMTDGEFAELVKEVRHLGRLPKPIIVRPNGDAYEIIDGEHGWRAAQEVGFEEVPCEVIDADEFEVRRQTYKRNRHGAHHPVLLGRMFREMMTARDLSQRQLADAIDVSEGTIRNVLEYAKAADVRNDYAFENLSVKQVRVFNRLPPKIGAMWLDCGADFKALFQCKTDEVGTKLQYSLDRTIRSLGELEGSGLVEYLQQRPHSPQGFGEAVKQLERWEDWEQSWLRCKKVSRDDLRQYTRHYFSGEVWHVREDSMMNGALECIIDRQNAKFLLTPEEFSHCIDMMRLEPSSFLDFQDQLLAAVMRKGHNRPESKYWVRRDLVQAEIDERAPDFIKQSKLPIDDKYHLVDLFEKVGDTAAMRELAQERTIPLEKGKKRSQTIRDRYDRICQRLDRETALKFKLASRTTDTLADSIVTRFYKDGSLAQSLRKKLSSFTIEELAAVDHLLDKLIGYEQHIQTLMNEIHTLHSGRPIAVNAKGEAIVQEEAA